ncbi:hydrogenase maturation protease [bacterium]|nr:hydrogenase maturation protease [bacterium]
MERAGTVILGLGNPILTDDAVGVRLAGEARCRFGARPDVEIHEECPVGGLELLAFLDGYRRAIVIDAIHTEGGRTGDCYRFTATALRGTVNLNNVHDANFATALALGRRLGQRLPEDDEIHVFAVEVADDLTFGTELSAELAPCYPLCREQVLAGIEELLAEAPAEAP